MDIQPMYALVARMTRPGRMRHFQSEFRVTSESRVLDVGGNPATWQRPSTRPRLTMLNVIPPDPDTELGRDMQWVMADGRSLPFMDKAFEIVYSNSVIEHLATAASQERFAAEIARVGKGYFVQTPNRWFPIEPHYLTPLIHFLPHGWRRRLVRNFTVWGRVTRPTARECEAIVREIRLLDAAAMRRLFPDARIRKERFLGLPKALIAERLPASVTRGIDRA